MAWHNVYVLMIFFSFFTGESMKMTSNMIELSLFLNISLTRTGKLDFLLIFDHIRNNIMGGVNVITILSF